MAHFGKEIRMQHTQQQIAVIGAGAWGTALAIQAARAGHHVYLWSRHALPSIQRTMPRLPHTPLPDTVSVHTEFPQQASLVIIATPLKGLRDVLDKIPSEAPLVLCCKGIEAETLLLPEEIVKTRYPSAHICFLSGPNFAHEIAQGHPAASVVAGHNQTITTHVAHMLSTSFFRIYTSDDPKGVQICGAAKNVIAIACGAIMGAQFGENAQAALICRALKEIGRLCEAYGGQMATLSGLAGIGDIILTCTSPSSRNYKLGIALGKGATLEEILSHSNEATEGAFSAPALLQMARNKHIDTPIIEAICTVLEGKSSVMDAAHTLFSRPLQPEY